MQLSHLPKKTALRRDAGNVNPDLPTGETEVQVIGRYHPHMGDPSHSIPPQVWHQPAMLAAARARDVPAVYRLLTEAGIAQGRIAARCPRR